MNKNNSVVLVGEVGELPKFSHEFCSENFYEFSLIVKRKSGAVDFIPVIVSEYVCNIKEICASDKIRIEGEFRSYNLHEKEKNKLMLYVFATEIQETNYVDDTNNISLNGYICKDPIHRTTPLGREITDIMLAANRVNGKSDYVPCVVWGRLARVVANYSVGDLLKINGRIQSREYQKIIDNKTEMKIAYEVSATSIIKEDVGVA